MPDAHKNFIFTTVATAPSPATSGTSLTVSAGYGANLPAAPFNMTVWPAGAQPSVTNAEIVRVTASSTDTLTITRAQEGTSARSIVGGDQIALTITAKTLADLEAKVWVNFDGTTAANVTGTYSRTSPSTTLTINIAGHGCIVGNHVYASFTSGTGVSGAYPVVSVIDANNFTITTVATTTTSGNVTLLRRAIRGSSGVTNVTYLNAGGQYRVNFSTLMADVNYGVFGWCAGTVSGIGICSGTAFSAHTTGSVYITSINSTAYTNVQTICVQILR
jgi:hypothetical protein